MKKIYAFMIVYIIVLFCQNWKVSAWDFPLTLSPAEISFNHGGSYSAFDIRKNASTDITSPEYVAGSKNEEFAYKLGDTPNVLVKFYTDDPDTTQSLTIDAIAINGFTTWDLAYHEAYFDTSGNSSNTTFGSGSAVPNTVQNCTVMWSWRVLAAGGNYFQTPYYMGTTTHDFYTLLDTPQSPMSITWTDVLEYACVWANGATSVGEVVSEITTGAYNSGFKDYDSGNWHYNGNLFYLSDFFYDSTCDCGDMAGVVQLFSNALGVSCSSVGFRTISGPFVTKSIDPIGSPSWGSRNWPNHRVGWYNGLVYDACIQLTNPTRIPTGEDIAGDYKDDLYYSGSWSPQGADHYSSIN